MNPNVLNVSELAYHMKINANDTNFNILGGAVVDYSNNVVNETPKLGALSPKSVLIDIAENLMIEQDDSDILVAYLPARVLAILTQPTVIKNDTHGAEIELLEFLIKKDFLQKARLIYIQLRSDTVDTCHNLLQGIGFHGNEFADDSFEYVL